MNSMVGVVAPISDEALYAYLKENEYVDAVALEKALSDATQKKSSLYEALLHNEVITDANVGKVIAEYLHLPFVELAKQTIPDEVLRLIPESVAQRHQVIIFEHTPEIIKVASANPDSKEALQWISQKLGKELSLHFATPYDMRDALKRYRSQLAATFDELLKSKKTNDDGTTEVPVAEVVDTLISYAYQNKASDIHIEPRELDSLVRFRIDGVLHDVLTFPHDLHDRVVTRIKVSSKLRTDEHLSAQDGKFRVVQDDEELDVRVSILPVVGGEKVVMRLLSANSRQFGLVDLGMNDQDLSKVRSSFTKPYGMILSTGPTGSGKTTTMYAILKILNVRERNIATIEDPVEYEIGGINQIQVNAKTNLTFANGLRSILRQDPDVIYVGEIRDEETASIAINSATTGHLVLSTLHTNNAAGALPRLLDMNIEPFLVASTVNTIVAQRLVRKICDTCRVSTSTSREELTHMVSPELIKRYFGDSGDVRTYQGKGCPVCYNTGYRGRVGVFEVLVVSSAIQKLIIEKAASDLIEQKAREEGMTTMIEDGLNKVQRGLTTIEEVLRATKE